MAEIVKTAATGLLLLFMACGGARDKSSPAVLEHVLQASDKERPAGYPGSVWMACDFELERRDITWIGSPETGDIPLYPGNSAALSARVLAGTGALTLSVRPVIPPVIGADSRVSFRYHLEGAERITLQAGLAGGGQSWAIALGGLDRGHWASADVPLSLLSPAGTVTAQEELEGKRLQELTFTINSADSGVRLTVDDVICYSAREDIAGGGGAFPARVILLEPFDYPGEQHALWMGHYHLDRPGADSIRGVARGVPTGDGHGRRVRVSIDPIQHAGATNRLRFHYMLKGAASLQVQIFDLTMMDNRHILLDNLEQGLWCVADLDFTRDSRRNDGTVDTLRAGNLLDDIFFFTVGAADSCELFVDNLVLYDAGEGE